MSKRRLVAIMFTDIEGYTALMQESEGEAMLFRDVHRRIFNSATEKFNGEIIQYYGDGTLSIFDSAVDAVRCGMAMQLAFQQKPGIPVRIGIHSGDIILSEEDIIGDAVNVASRVESLAVAGSVFISDKVFDEIKNSNDIETTYLDTFKLKNVKRPLGIYAISNEGLVVPPRKAITGKLVKENPTTRWILTGLTVVLLLLGIVWGIQNLRTVNREQTIVLLPPKNYTGKDDLDYFVEGIHDLLYGDLSKVSSKLRVISPFTARALTNAGKSIPEMAAEVNADFFLETSVSCMEDNNNMCINARLIEVGSQEQQIWAQDYYEKKEEILNFNHFLVKKIAGDINVHLTPEVEIALARSGPVDTSALDLYLRGQYYLDQINPGTLEKAAHYFNRAVEKDPDWAPPYAGLAMVVSYQMQVGFVSPATGIPKLFEYLPTALELGPYSSQAYLAKAISAVWAEWNWEKGETAFLESLRRDPNDPLCRMFYAHLLTILRRTDEALEQAKIASELDPLRPFVLGLHGVVLKEAGECEAAIVQCEKALSVEPNHGFTQRQLRDAYECIGDYDRAFEMWKKSQHDFWERYDVTVRFEKAYYERGWKAVIEEALQINEEVFAKDNRMHIFMQGSRSLKVNKFDQAIAYFERAYEIHDPNLPYISATSTYDQLKHHPRYIGLLKKMSLPTQ